MANKPLTIRWGADIRDVLTKTDKMSRAIGKLGSKMGAAVKVGAVGAGVALAGFATAGVKAFGDFEKAMNEVRTLLPDMGQKEFEDMRSKVMALSKEMGITSKEVVPALYQSISAGVPAENVFEFMEIASKAAIGGVTELETAVDGITTVVNGYGEEVISAQEAADMMFTTVKLGKTNFEELSARLSNVTPMAAALGVGFDEVSAAMAVMTSQGIKTGVATTSIRAALAELGKSGSIASDKFTDIAGKSFPAFIEEGGTLGGALTILKTHVDENNLELQNMFGSIEAGTGALAIMANNGQSYAEALDAMGGSAGAVDTAFSTMDSGVNRASERLGVQFETLKLKFGEFLTPVVATALEKLQPVIDKVVEWFDEGGPVRTALSKTAEVLGTLWDKLVETAGTVWDKISPVFDPIKTFITETVPGWYDTVIGKVSEWAGHAWDTVGQPVFDTVKTFITETIPGWYDAVIEKVKEWAGHAWEAVGLPSLEGAKTFITETLPGWYDSAIEKGKELGPAAGEGLSTAWTKIQEVWDKVAPAFDWVGPALTAVGDSLAGLFKEGGGLHSLFEAVSGLMPYLRLMIKFFGAIAVAVGAVILALAPILRGVLVTSIQLFSGALNIVAGVVKLISGLLTGDWSRAWDGVKDMFGGLLDIMTAPFTLLWETLQGILDGLIGKLLSKIGEIATSAGGALWDGIVAVVTEGPGKLLDAIKGVMPSWEDIKKIAKAVGQFLLDAYLWPITEGAPALFNAIKGILPTWDDIKNAAKTIGEALMDGIITIIKEGPGLILDALKAIIPSAGDIIGGIAGGLKKLNPFSSADGAVFTKPALTTIAERGRAEAVLPLEGPEARRWMSRAGIGGGGGGGVTVNIQGDVYSGPDEFADKVVSALRRQERVHGQITDLSAV